MGTQHPVPENIPHLTSPGPSNGNSNGAGAPGHPGVGAQSGSPVKESSFLHRETSIDEQDNEQQQGKGQLEQSVSPPLIKEGVPIRWQS